jgi:NADPH:quinone reductase-like Zn-dependent oxidoreductase
MILRQPGLENIVKADVAEPGQPARGEIAVRLHANSINYHDYAVATGAITVSPDRILLSDGAGEVVAVGEGVDEFSVGDAVVSTFFPPWEDGPPSILGFGDVPGDGSDGYARDAVVAPAGAFTRVPNGYSHVQAATLPTAALTAWRALVPDGPLHAGQSVLVQGTGGVSLFALQFAKARGATVIATSSSDAKLERLTALGADHVINYQDNPKWGSAARQLSGGGVDHVVEVGGAETLPQSIAATRVGGHIAMVGIMAGMQGAVPVGALIGKQIRLQGLTVGSRRHQRDMIEEIEAHGIEPVVDRTFPLEELAEAFRYQETGSHFGKIAISI